MPKRRMGCWCPVDEPDGAINKLIIILDILAILVMLYIATTMENWLVYMPSVLLITGSLILITSKTYRR